MNIDSCISEDIHTSGGGEIPPCAGLTSNALPKAQSCKKAESSHTGVSTSYALSEDPPHWYALRCTYGREKTAYEYMTAKGITAFYPTQTTVKLIKGKRKTVTESLLPNIFFAYGTLDQISLHPQTFSTQQELSFPIHYRQDRLQFDRPVVGYIFVS